MGDSADTGAHVLAVGAAQVRGFRLGAHRLDQRIGGDGAVSEASGLCGLQDSPPGAAAIALHARVEGVTPEAVERALAVDRTLVRTWAMRGSPHVVPTVDLPVFTTGVLPVTETARTHLVRGVQQALDVLAGGLDDYVEATADAVPDVLSGRRLEIDGLGRKVAERIGDTLPEDERDIWQAEGPYAQGQPLGEGVVHFCLRILTLRQVLCFAPRQAGTAPFVLLSEWLDEVPHLPAARARRELAIRYLRAHGPSTPAGLAGWLGVAPSDAGEWWRLVLDDVAPVDVDGARRWLLADDLDTLAASGGGTVAGVRLLPPGDPLLQLPDRDVLVPDRDEQRQLWRSLHSPGALLVDGDVAGTWRSRKRSRRLDVTVRPFHSLPPSARAAIEAEAQLLALVRETDEATVAFGGSSSRA